MKTTIYLSVSANSVLVRVEQPRNSPIVADYEDEIFPNGKFFTIPYDDLVLMGSGKHSVDLTKELKISKKKK